MSAETIAMPETLPEPVDQPIADDVLPDVSTDVTAIDEAIGEAVPDDYTPYGASVPSDQQAFAQKVHETTGAIRLRIRKFGVTRACDKDQVKKAAVSFDAAPELLSLRKKLLDTKGKPYRRVQAALYAAKSVWRKMTIPYPENGIRLARKVTIPKIIAELVKIKQELADAKNELSGWFEAEKAKAKERLGDLFNEADYPISIREEFAIDWDLPPIDPPAYLKQMNPDLYAAERKKINQKFEQAASMAEEAYAEVMHKMVQHLSDLLTPSEDGKKKVMQKTSVTHLQEFVENFKTVGLCNNEQLNELVDQMEKLLGGVDVKDLRKDDGLRANIKNGVDAVLKNLQQHVAIKGRDLQLDFGEDGDDADPVDQEVNAAVNQGAEFVTPEGPEADHVDE